MQGILMKKHEAMKVSNLCGSGLYPPTNPLVLLRAGITLYKDYGVSEELKRVIRWLNYTLEEEN
jgi:hypothetical protein